MNEQSWGSFLLILGLVQVVLAGFFLRWNKAGKSSREKMFWVWVGRLGAVLCAAGVLLMAKGS